MSSPGVAIVIPCHARTSEQLDHLDETLATVDAQTGDDYEVVVVDDGSPLQIAAVASTHRRTTCIHQPNAGPAVARNAGIAATSAPVLLFLDSDDHLLPRALEVGVSALESHPECGFTVGPREEMMHDGTPVPWAVPAPPPGSDIYTALLGFDWYIIPPSCAMFRRDVVQTLGGFRDPWGPDDLDFYLRAAHAYPAFCFQAPPITRYRRYSTSTSRDGERMLHGIRTVYDRQRTIVAGNREGELALERGLQRLIPIFIDCVIENLNDRLRTGDKAGALRSAHVLAREDPARWQAFVKSRHEPPHVFLSIVEEVATATSRPTG